mgnify:FL=1
MNTTPRVSLHLVRGFWVAARQLSFTKAAAELFVTQSAVSREIKKLEEQLGQPLFRRVNRTLQLTQAGEELYRAVSEALVLIDAATDRLAGVERSLTVTTTIPLASLWLVPRLPRFTQQHPELDVRIVASNDVLDLVQAQVDIAIRYASLGGATPLGKPLVGYSTFPVCTPALMRDPARPLRTFADLAQHVLLEFETTVHGRPWYDWEQWFSAVKTAKFKPAGRQRFSHYDQVVEAALAGSGVAIGKRPHLNGKLQAGTLCAPFGTDGVATLGSFYVVVAPSATGRGAVGEAFVAWLRSEVRRDERALAKKRD